MRIFFKFTLIVCAFVFAFSPAHGQTTNTEKVIVDNKEHYVTYRVNGDNVIFTLEFIDDFTDNSNGVFPNLDFASIMIDVNQNAKVDRNIDTAYSQHAISRALPNTSAKPLLCTQFLYTANSGSVCGAMKSKASLDFRFQSTGKEAREHPVYRFTIPKKELSANGESAHIRLRFHSAGKGYKVYPAQESRENFYSFSKVLEVQF